jgi:5'-nucleotidase
MVGLGLWRSVGATFYRWPRSTDSRRKRIRLSRRLAIIAAALARALATGGVAGSAEAKPRAPKELQLQVLSFNDFHGHLQPPEGTDATLGATLDPSNTQVGGAEYLASTLDALRAKAQYSQTVAAGDLIGGSPFLSGLFHDEPAVESLNAMGLDVSSVGNHEFDEGVDELLRMQRGGCHPDDGCYEPWGEDGNPGADFPWLAANVVDEDTGRTILPATAIKKVNGVKVGYSGMTLEATPTLVAQSGIQDVEFRDEVQTANRAARQLRRHGVQTIIVLLHEGGYQTGTYQQCVGISGPIVQIAGNLHPEIDLVVTGHTHQPNVCNIPDPAGKNRLVTSAASFGRVVTETNLVITSAPARSTGPRPWRPTTWWREPPLTRSRPRSSAGGTRRPRRSPTRSSGRSPRTSFARRIGTPRVRWPTSSPTPSWPPRPHRATAGPRSPS